MTGVQTCALPICFPVTIDRPVLTFNFEYTDGVIYDKDDDEDDDEDDFEEEGGSKKDDIPF